MKRTLNWILGVIAGGWFFTITAQAATKTWSNSGTDYNAGASWGGTAPGTGDNALFNGTAVTQPKLSASIANQGLTFGSTGLNYVLSATSPFALTLSNTGTGSSSAINASSTSGINEISAPLILGGTAATTATFAQAAGGTLKISGNISSTFGITGISLATVASGNATYTLSGNNTYSGITTINNNDTLNIGSATAISAGALVFAGSTKNTIDNSSGGPLTLANNNAITLSGAGGLTFLGANDLSFGTGAVDMNANSKTITVSGNKLTVGAINNGATKTLTKAGAGTLSLTAANTYAATVISEGTIALGSSSALGTGTVTFGALTGASASTPTLTITGTNTLTSGLSFVANTTTIAGGNNSATISGGTLGIGANQSIDVADSAAAVDLTISSVISGVGSGLFKKSAGTLLLTGTNTYTGGTIVRAGTLLVGGDVAVSTDGALGNSTNTINLADGSSLTSDNVSLLTQGAYTIGRDISVNANNSSGTTTLGGNTDNTSTYSGLIIAQRNFTITQVATTGGHALNLTGVITSSNTIAHTITFAGPGAISVSGVIENGWGTNSVNITGGVVTFSGTNTYTGTTTVNGGSLLVNGLIGTNSVTVAGGNTLGGTGSIGGNVTYGSGAFALFTNGGTLAISGTLTANANVVHLNLSNNVPANTYLLATYNTSGSSGTFASTPVIVNGGSFAANTTNFITTSGGHVYLVVQNLTPSTPPSTNITYTVSSGQMVLNWPAGLGWQLQAQTNSLSIGLTTNWVTVPGATPPFTNNINPSAPAVFYRLNYP